MTAMRAMVCFLSTGSSIARRYWAGSFPRMDQMSSRVVLGAPGGDLVQRDGCRDSGVQRLGGRVDRDRDDLVAGFAHQPRETLALRTDHDHDGSVGERERGQRDVAPAIEPEDEHALLLEFLESR